MISMSILLVAWLVLVAIFVLFAILTIAVHIRFGISSPFTTVSAGIFLVVSILVIFASGVYFLQVDWSKNVGLFNASSFGSPQSVTEFEL